jgi:deoxyadenosine/deoxycytidine kinase
MARSRYIAIEGPIGVGKTSLARRLASSLNGELLLEQPAENPFLERFYADPRGGAQVEQLRQADLFAEARVADFLIDKDRLFAELNLDRHELDLYDRVAASLAVEIPAPDLVVYLQAPVDTLVARIGRRGIAYEQQVGRRYLERLAEAYARFFHAYTASPLLIVNAAVLDPVHNDDHYDLLLAEISRTRSGRHFFNPIASALA